MCISDIYDDMINTKSINVIEDTLKAKLPTGTVIIQLPVSPTANPDSTPRCCGEG